MDERNWLWFSVTTFFAFVVISYVRESKLVFLVEKYSNQLENMQNYTGPNDQLTMKSTQQQTRQLSLNSPNVKIYKIPAHLPDDQMIDFPDLQEMIENHYSEYEGSFSINLLIGILFSQKELIMDSILERNQNRPVSKRWIAPMNQSMMKCYRQSVPHCRLLFRQHRLIL